MKFTFHTSWFWMLVHSHWSLQHFIPMTGSHWALYPIEWHPKDWQLTSFLICYTEETAFASIALVFLNFFCTMCWFKVDAWYSLWRVFIIASAVSENSPCLLSCLQCNSEHFDLSSFEVLVWVRAPSLYILLTWLFCCGVLCFLF